MSLQETASLLERPIVLFMPARALYRQSQQDSYWTVGQMLCRGRDAKSGWPSAPPLVTSSYPKYSISKLDTTIKGLL